MQTILSNPYILSRPYMPVKPGHRCMYKLNVIAVISIVAAVSLIVGMASPLAFAAQHENMTMNMDDNMSSMGNMTGGNATSMAGNMTETESLTTAGETGVCQPCCIGDNPRC